MAAACAKFARYKRLKTRKHQTEGLSLSTLTYAGLNSNGCKHLSCLALTTRQIAPFTNEFQPRAASASTSYTGQTSRPRLHHTSRLLARGKTKCLTDW